MAPAAGRITDSGLSVVEGADEAQVVLDWKGGARSLGSVLSCLSACRQPPNRANSFNSWTRPLLPWPATFHWQPQRLATPVLGAAALTPAVALAGPSFLPAGEPMKINPGDKLPFTFQ